MTAFICVTCGVQHAPSDEPPATCAICEDERQYVGRGGQRWISLDEMRGHYTNILTEEEPNLVRIGTTPRFAIGQQAYLVQTPAGNVMWDCVSYLDEQTASAVRELGGIAAIAISHPHFYASSVEWAETFGARLCLPATDRAFVMRPSPSIELFEDEAELVPGVRVIRVGGHFHGSAVLHWPAGSESRGVLLTGDSIAVVADGRSVSFMYSYPNTIPLSAEDVRSIESRVLPLQFDRLYAGWAGDVLPTAAKEAVRQSVDRYIRILDGTWPRR